VYVDGEMSKERLLVASAAEIQLLNAADLLTRAVSNLNTLKHGIQPALDNAKRALKECEKAHKCVSELLERIPIT
jgi:hypothetical protein